MPSSWVGDLVTGPGVISATAEGRKVLTEIQDGTFAKNFRAEYAGGMRNFQRLYKADHDRPLEVTGRKLRGTMPWLKAKTPPTA